MLPFLRERHEAAMGDAEDEAQSFDILDGIVDDIFQAMDTRDKSLLKAAFEALIAHVQELDDLQDIHDFESQQHIQE